MCEPSKKIEEFDFTVHKRGDPSFYGKPPKKIENWPEWWNIIISHIDEIELRLDEMWEMYQSDDFTAIEAVEYLKLERGL